MVNLVTIAERPRRRTPPVFCHAAADSYMKRRRASLALLTYLRDDTGLTYLEASEEAYSKHLTRYSAVQDDITFTRYEINVSLKSQE